MDFPKIKTVLIVMFLMINLFLLGDIYYTEHIKNTVSDQTITDTIAVLEKNNILVAPSIISPKKQGLCAYEVRTTVDSKIEVMERILHGEAEKELEIDTSMIRYTGENGGIAIKDNYEFEFNGIFEGKGQGTNKSDYVKTAMQFAEELSFGVFGIITYSEADNNGEVVVTLGQSLGKHTMENTNLAITVTEKGVIKAKGTWIFGELKEISAKKITDGINALLLYPTYVEEGGEKEIVKLEITYMPNIGATSTKLLPAYKITEKTGEIVYISALTGEEMVQ